MRVLLTLTSIILGGCIYQYDKKAAADAIADFKCPAGDEVVYSAWGFNGITKSCKSGKGTSVTIENGVLWSFGSWDEIHQIERIVHYNDRGVIIQRSEFNPVSKQTKVLPLN
jgi:hypothetical protein